MIPSRSWAIVRSTRSVSTRSVPSSAPATRCVTIADRTRLKSSSAWAAAGTFAVGNTVWSVAGWISCAMGGWSRSATSLSANGSVMDTPSSSLAATAIDRSLTKSKDAVHAVGVAVIEHAVHGSRSPSAEAAVVGPSPVVGALTGREKANSSSTMLPSTHSWKRTGDAPTGSRSIVEGPWPVR